MLYNEREDYNRACLKLDMMISESCKGEIRTKKINEKKEGVIEMKPGSLFDRIFGFLGQLIALNLLWIVCSLPVITAGASTTALFYCTLKLHKDGDIRVFHDFFKSFKQNFKQSTLIWILMAAAGIFIYMEKEALATMPGSMSQIFNYVILGGLYSSGGSCTVCISNSCSI